MLITKILENFLLGLFKGFDCYKYCGIKYTNQRFEVVCNGIEAFCLLLLYKFDSGHLGYLGYQAHP